MKLWGSLSELVSLIFRKDSQQITVRPNQATTYTSARDVQLPPGDAAHVLTSASSTQTLTNKSIDADTNTITNIEDADIKVGAAIDAAKLHDGSVSNTEFGYLGGVTSDLQTQLDAKLDDFSSSEDNRLVRTDGTGGSAVQESVATLSDAGALSGLTQLDVDNLRIDGNTVSSTSGDVNIDAGANAVSITTANVLLRGGAELAFYDNDNSNAIVVSVPNNVTTNRTPQIPDDTGNFVLDSATQTLTNKTLTAPTLDDYFDVNEEAAPGTPDSGKVRVYAKSDKKLYTKDSSGVEQEIGSGSASGNVSFFFDDLENGSTANWTGYADAAAATPVDGTGGTATTLTVTASSSSPLRETFSLSVAKSASNGQGQGIAAAVTIPSGYAQAAKRVIEFLWDGSGAGYVAGDMACYIYDVTNATLITPSVAALPAAKVPIQLSWDASSSVSYRLIFHVATTNATAYTVKLDDITVGPGQIIPVPAVGTGQSYTPTTTGFGTPTITYFNYSQTSDRAAISGRFTAGTVSAANATIAVPTGLTINRALYGNSATVVGTWVRNNTTSNARKRGKIVVSGTDTELFFTSDDYAGTLSPFTAQTGSTLFSSSDIISVDIPALYIAEWAGAPNYAGQNSKQYAAWNGSTTVYGPDGALIPSITASAVNTTTNHTLTLLSPLQADEVPVVEIKRSNGVWLRVGNSFPYANLSYFYSGTAAGRRYYGIGTDRVANSTTQITLIFGNAGATLAIADGLGENYPIVAGDRYRVSIEKIGAASGFGAATSTSMGLLQPPTSTADVKATQMGLKTYAHGTTYNGGNAPTITLNSGGGTLTGVDYSAFIPYQMQNGAWRLKGSFGTTMSSTARTEVVFKVAGIFMAATQPISGSPSPGAAVQRMRAYADNNFAIAHVSASTTAYYVNFDIELTSKPTWAY